MLHSTSLFSRLVKSRSKNLHKWSQIGAKLKLKIFDSCLPPLWQSKVEIIFCVSPKNNSLKRQNLYRRAFQKGLLLIDTGWQFWMATRGSNIFCNRKCIPVLSDPHLFTGFLLHEPDQKPGFCFLNILQLCSYRIISHLLSEHLRQCKTTSKVDWFSNCNHSSSLIINQLTFFNSDETFLKFNLQNTQSQCWWAHYFLATGRFPRERRKTKADFCHFSNSFSTPSPRF